MKRFRLDGVRNRFVGLWPIRRLATRPPLPPLSPRVLGLVRDASSGIITAIVTIAYCVSFSALVFQGNLQGGFAPGLSALLMGSAITGLVVALTTTLPPAGAGPDTPAVAVMSVLATTSAVAILSNGGTLGAAKEHALLAISLATLVTGLVLLAIGALRLGQLLRFVPYPVIGGFLAASGWLLITGALELVSGLNLGEAYLEDWLATDRLLKLVVGIGFALAIFLARRRTNSFFVIPLSLLIASLLLTLVLKLVKGSFAASWFLSQGGNLELWWPMAAMLHPSVDWMTLLRASAEIGAVAGVTAIALLLDVSSLEVARAKTADLDSEFRTNGFANVVAAVLGGASGNLSMQSSILIEEAGGASRWAGVFSALAIGLVLLVGDNVASLVPVPLLGGLLIYLGAVILIEALLRAPAQRSMTDLILALAIFFAIVWFGYLQGVVLGLIGACLTFAFNYSRIGVVRRHLTRADFASNVERSAEQTRHLADMGQRIHVFWLSGFIFFGSSNGVFEEVRRTIDLQKEPPIRFIILDFSGVSGADTSALLSLIKLRNYCDQFKVILVICGLSDSLHRTLEKGRISIFSDPHKLFASRNEALEWCEEAMLAERSLDSDVASDFESWLAREIGLERGFERLKSYFKRREIATGTVVYRQGELSDTIDLVGQGRVAIQIADDQERPVRLRSMAGQTVVGEMGFFRQRPRAASVIAQDDVILYTLSRADMDRMIGAEPELGKAFLEFIIRTLSDRVEFANREIAALV